MSNEVYQYIKKEAEMSLRGPLETDFCRGYLAGLLVLAKDALGVDMNKQPFAAAEDKLRRELTLRSRELQEPEEWIGE